jgi:hypothetical protein
MLTPSLPFAAIPCSLPVDAADPLGAYPSGNFETLGNGMVTMFQFIISENWVQVRRMGAAAAVARSRL